MVVLGKYKLTRGRESNTIHLYDLKQDPDELTDVAATHPQMRDKLLHLLDDWTASFPSTFAQFKNEHVTTSTVPEEVKRVFESLGYVSAQ